LENDINFVPGESTFERKEVGDTGGCRFGWKLWGGGSGRVNPSGLAMHTKLPFRKTKDVWGGENARGWRFVRKMGKMVAKRGYNTTKFWSL